jgi:hypothetical protein
MAVQTRGIFPELNDNIDKTIFTLLFDARKELPNRWKKVYEERKSKRKFERVMSVTGVGDVPEKGEGEAYTSSVIRPGWSKDYLHTEFGMMFEATQTALEDDQYDQLSNHARWFMFSANVVVEKRAALLFNNGFSSEQSPDGVTIFNSSHVLKGGGTARNVPANAADLSATSLEQALIDFATQTKVEAGQLAAPPSSLILHVPPQLEFQAVRILNSTLRPGSADNDVNAMKSERKWTVVVNEYLSDEDAWFLLDANKKGHGFVSYSRVGMSMEPAMTDPRTRNRLYPIRWRRSFGNEFWQGSYGNQGA